MRPRNARLMRAVVVLLAVLACGTRAQFDDDEDVVDWDWELDEDWDTWWDDDPFGGDGTGGESLCVSDGETFTARTGTLRSQPEDEPVYASGESCEWTVAPLDLGENECVVIVVERFDLEHTWDKLTLTGAGGGQPEVEELRTGLLSEGARISLNRPLVTLHFESDSSVTESGFVLHYEVEECGDAPTREDHVCPDQGVHTQREGTLHTTPASRQEPLPGMECVWTLAPALADDECLRVWPVEWDLGADTMALLVETDEWALVETAGWDVRSMAWATRGAMNLTFSTDIDAPDEWGWGHTPTGAVLRWEVTACDTVAHLVAPREGEEHHVRTITATSGTMPWPVEAVWQAYRRAHTFPTITLAPPEIAAGDKCLSVSVNPDWYTRPTARVRVRSGETDFLLKQTSSDIFVRLTEVFFPRPVTITWIDDAVDHVRGDDDFSIEWAVVDCEGGEAAAERMAHVCETVRDALRPQPTWRDFVATKGRCCGLYRAEVGSARGGRVHLRCEGLRVTRIETDSMSDGVEFPYHIFDDAEQITIRNSHVHPSQGGAWPRSLRYLTIDRVTGLGLLDIRDTRVETLQVTSAHHMAGARLSATIESLSVISSSLDDMTFVEGLPALRTITLSRNVLTDPTPRAIAWPSSLTAANIGDTPLASLPLHEGMLRLRCDSCGLRTIGRLPSTLEELELSANRIAHAPDTWPPPLRRVILSRNDLVGELPPFRTGCRVTLLQLEENELTALDVSACTSLELLNARGNRKLAHVGTLPDSLAFVDVSDTSVPVLARYPAQLAQLDARGLDWDHLPPLPRTLTDLDVSGTPVGRIEFAAPPRHMFTLSASNCGLTETPHLDVFLSDVDLSHNALTAFPPMTHEYSSLRTLDVSHNALTAFHMDVGMNVAVLDVSHNALVDMGDHVFARSLDVSFNKLAALPALYGCKEVSAQHNELVEVVVAPTISRLNVEAYDLTYLDMSHNNLTSVLGLSAMDGLETVLLHHNRLRTWSPSVRVSDTLDVSYNALESFDDVASTIMHGARMLDASNNKLRGTVAAFGANFASLNSLSLSHNELSGPVPDMGHMTELRQLDIFESGFSVNKEACRRDPLGEACLGKALRVVGWAQDETGTMLCPELAGVGSLQVGSSRWTDYTSTVMCECAFGHVGRYGECHACPPHALCVRSTIVPERGHWLHVAPGWDAATLPHAVVACPPTLAHACAPHNDAASVVAALDAATDDGVALAACREGHTDRLCARCETGYFQWGNRCRACPAAGALAALLTFSAVVIAGVCVYAYLIRPSSSAAFKILLFFVQTIDLARTTGVPMHDDMAQVFNVLGSVMVEIPGIECVWSSYGFHEDSYAAMAMPLMATALVLSVFTAGYVARRALGKGTDGWWEKNIGALLLLNFFLYLRVSSSVLAPLRCEHDAFVDEDYFASAPSEQCDSVLVGLSWMMVVVYLIGMPAAISAVLFTHRHTLNESHTAAQFSFLFAQYHPRYWYWEGVITARKILVLVFFASFQRSSVMVPLCIFLLFVASLLLQRAVQPFAAKSDNNIEYALLCALTVLFALLIVSNAPRFNVSAWLGVLVLIVQFVCVGAVVLHMVVRQRERGGGLLGSKGGASFLNLLRSRTGKRGERAERSPLLTGEPPAE